LPKNRISQATRRNFLKAATSSLALPGLTMPGLTMSAASVLDAPPEAQASQETPQGLSSSPARENIAFPRVFTGSKLAHISFPLGGIGTGCIGLGGRGDLRDWEIFNRSHVGNVPDNAWPALWVKTSDGTTFSSVLERRFLPPFDLRDNGVSNWNNVPGLPRLAEAKFRGSFPLASIEFHDPASPVQVSLKAFSPFQPLETDDSGLPCAVLTYEVHNPGKTSVEAVIAWSIQNPVGDGQGRTNQARDGAGLTGIQMTDPSLPEHDPLRGTFAFAALASAGAQPDRQTNWTNIGRESHIDHFWRDHFSKDGTLGSKRESKSQIGSVSLRHTIPAGERRQFGFLLAWHFPNRTPEWSGWDAPKGEEKTILGNFYCTRFADAWAAAEYVATNLPRLESGTRKFVEVMRESTLPDVVKEAATANLSTLVSNTAFRIADGSYHGFEGCGDLRGLGFGTCTHVWNYEVATQYLFPSLARSLRDTSFGYATDEEGHMDFRHKLPLGKEHWGAAAADGQMGQIVKLYFDWKFCGDTDWLKKKWPAAKRALLYAWRPGGWDGDQDGVMEGVQHNTYDIEFFGPNPLCETWYLAALKACTEMAKVVGDDELSAKCAGLFQKGSAWTDANLFNGEYYWQEIRGIPKEKIATGLVLNEEDLNFLHPDVQIGHGCCVDQLVGQYMANLAGLGELLDGKNIRATLAAIDRYNFKSNLEHHVCTERGYAVNDEGGLVVTDYTKTGREIAPMPYYSEVWTGLEYEAAVLMFTYGMNDKALKYLTTLRSRYDGERRNPYGETEYGYHYARPMASWALVPAVSGFHYDALAQRLAIVPRVASGKVFKTFWSTPTAWGRARQNAAQNDFVLEPVTGKLSLLELAVKFPSAASAKVTVGGKVIAAKSSQKDGGTAFRFDQAVTISPESPLRIS
jgi:uncharacterized protein (DUF608 family)